MAINTNRITSRLEKSKTKLTDIERLVHDALFKYNEADKAYLKLDESPMPVLPENPSTVQIAEHQNNLEFHTDTLKKAAADAKAAFVNLRTVEAANIPRRDALVAIIAQQTAAVERKARVYPALLKSHLRRRANAGDKTAKPAA